MAMAPPEFCAASLHLCSSGSCSTALHASVTRGACNVLCAASVAPAAEDARVLFMRSRIVRIRGAVGRVAWLKYAGNFRCESVALSWATFCGCITRKNARR